MLTKDEIIFLRALGRFLVGYGEESYGTIFAYTNLGVTYWLQAQPVTPDGKIPIHIQAGLPSKSAAWDFWFNGTLPKYQSRRDYHGRIIRNRFNYSYLPLIDTYIEETLMGCPMRVENSPDWDMPFFTKVIFWVLTFGGVIRNATTFTGSHSDFERDMVMFQMNDDFKALDRGSG